jgi:hypothetical protein
MKLTLSQIVNGYAALARVGSEKMNIKLAYNIQRNMRIMEPEAQQFEKARVELVKTKYGKEDPETKAFSVPPPKLEAFQKELGQLLEVEVDLDIHTVQMDDFSIEITPIDLMALHWMFVNGETEPNGHKPRARK